MKNTISIAICCLGLINNSFSQTYNRMENPNYARTTLFEDFNSSLNPNIWNATIHEIKSGSPNYAPNLYAFIDSSATVKINPSTGSLELSMLSYANYPAKDWNNNTIRVNFIAGEIQSSQRFSYGVFECNATFSDGYGSFPAFWLYDNTPCQPRDRDEIDIVELKIRSSNSNSDFNYNTFVYHSSDCSSSTGHEYHTFAGASGTHTFKCAWSPSQIEFWEDNTKVGIIVNTTQSWYPDYPMQIKLSQQVWNYNNTGSDYGIVTPQTSVFHWVRYKEFFLAPEITLSSNIICSTGTASMDVDPAATNVTWALSPGYLFNGAITGSGTSANITASSNQGKGKITYTFRMPITMPPYYETFTAEKELWIKGPDASETSFDVYRSDGVRATQVGGTFLMCPNTTYHIYVMNSGPVPLSNYTWTVPSAWTRNYTSQNIISVYTNSSPGGQVIVNATNTACNTTVPVITGYMGSNYSCGSYYMALTPNPSASETSIELSADGEKVVNENTQWNLEVYDQQQGLKEKKTEIKGKDAKINTSSWKDGVYIINAIVDGQKISEKLMVKH